MLDFSFSFPFLSFFFEKKIHSILFCVLSFLL